MWKYYAMLSAVFAALTAIFAKCGVKGVDSNLAAAIRTTVILLLTWGIVVFTGDVRHIHELSWRATFFLIASGIAAGLSWDAAAKTNKAGFRMVREKDGIRNFELATCSGNGRKSANPGLSRDAERQFETFGSCVSWLFYFKALQTGDVSRVAPIDKLSVVLVVIFGILFLHEKASWQSIAGAVCIAAGSLLLLHGGN